MEFDQAKGFIPALSSGKLKAVGRDEDSEIHASAKHRIKGRRQWSSSASSDSSGGDDASIIMPSSSQSNQNLVEHEDGEFSEESSEEEEDEFNDGYDDELMGDEADRERMALMTEREREQVIFERAERREKLKARFEIEKKLRQTRKLQSKSKHDKVKNRSMTRKKTMEGKYDVKTAAMDELRAQREDRRLRAEEKEKRRMEVDAVNKAAWLLTKKETGEAAGRPKLIVNQVYSSSESDSEDESPKPVIKVVRPREPGAGRSNEAAVATEALRESDVPRVRTARQLSRIQLTRQKCAKWVHLPFFNELILGCFVKIGMSAGIKPGESLYRISEIVDVFDGSTYELENTKTTKRVKIMTGRQTEVMRLSMFSNKEFTQDEFDRWKISTIDSGTELPTMEEILKKEADIRRAQDYRLSDHDISQMLEVKKKLNIIPRNYAFEKTILLKERAEARLCGNDKRVKELDNEIRDLDEKAKKEDTRTNSLAKIAVINERNRRKNREIMEIAILESQEHREGDGKQTEDPFIRRNTKPSRPTVRREKDGNLVDASPKRPDAADPKPEGSQPPMECMVVDEEPTSAAAATPEQDVDFEMPIPKGWIAVDNDGRRFHTPLDHSFPLRNMTFFDKGYMEEMFELHNFEVTGITVDEPPGLRSSVDQTKPAFNFPHPSTLIQDPHEAMFSPFGVVIPTPPSKPKKKITLEEYKRRRGMN